MPDLGLDQSAAAAVWRNAPCQRRTPTNLYQKLLDRLPKKQRGRRPPHLGSNRTCSAAAAAAAHLVNRVIIVYPEEKPKAILPAEMPFVSLPAIPAHCPVCNARIFKPNRGFLREHFLMTHPDLPCPYKNIASRPAPRKFRRLGFIAHYQQQQQ
jgi:hypothetical protein